MYVQPHKTFFSLSLNLDIWESKLVKCNTVVMLSHPRTQHSSCIHLSFLTILVCIECICSTPRKIIDILTHTSLGLKNQ